MNPPSFVGPVTTYITPVVSRMNSVPTSSGTSSWKTRFQSPSQNAAARRAPEPWYPPASARPPYTSNVTA